MDRTTPRHVDLGQREYESGKREREIEKERERGQMKKRRTTNKRKSGGRKEPVRMLSCMEWRDSRACADHGRKPTLGVDKNVSVYAEDRARELPLPVDCCPTKIGRAHV